MPPFEYRPFDGSRFTATIGDLLTRRGDPAAQAAQSIGQAVGGVAQTYAQEHANAPVRQLQTDALKLQVDDARATSEARAAARAQDQAFAKLLQQGADPVKAALLTLGPERGAKVAEGYKALIELQQGQVKDARDTAGRLAVGVKALSPELQQQFWPAIREASIKGGLGSAEHIPEQPTPEYFDAVIAWATGKPNTKDLMAVNPGDVLVDKNNPTAGAVFTAPPKTPDAAHSQESKFLLDGKSVNGDYIPGVNGQPGKYFFGGQDVTGRATPIPAATIAINAAKAAESADNRDELVEMLLDGRTTPSMLSKRGDFNELLAAANKRSKELTGRGFNPQKTELDYKAAQRWVTNMNGPQMLRFKGLAVSVVNTIDEVKTLANELKQGSVQKWNSASRKTIQQLYGNSPQSDLANRYMVALNTLKEEFANLANGGYAPTEDAWKLANEQVNGNQGFKDLTSSLTEVQRLINFRMGAFEQIAPTTLGGPAVSPTTTGGKIRARDTNGVLHEAAAGTALPAGWKVEP